MYKIFSMLENLLERGASPNTIIIEKDFAPIHYAAGMPSEDFSYDAMNLFLMHYGLYKFLNEINIILYI